MCSQVLKWLELHLARRHAALQRMLHTCNAYATHTCYALATCMLHVNKCPLFDSRPWQLLSTVLATPAPSSVSAVRFLTWMRHGRIHLEAGTWLLVNYGGQAFTARVQEMAAISRGANTTVSIGCGSCHAHSVTEGTDGMIKVPKLQQPSTCTVEIVPGVALTQLSCVDRGDHLEFRYVL